MGLFDKKYCDICGEKIGFLGNRKLSDGNMCKYCAKLISPYLTGRKSFTVSEMKEHLAYREENEKKVEKFSPTRTIGSETKLYIDDNKGQWLVSRYSHYKDYNPDVLTFAEVTGVTIDIDEDKDEIMRELPEGKRESYSPPRYKFSYNFYVEININCPWFSEIRFQVNESSIDGKMSVEYRNVEKQTIEIKNALTKVQSDIRQAADEAAKPRASMKCPYCGAVVIPDDKGKCEYCGSAINV